METKLPKETIVEQTGVIADEIANERLGTVTISPKGPVIAGSIGSWTLKYTVGSYGVDEGGTIKIAQRLPSDWETPQFDQPAASGYCTVTTTGKATLRPSFSNKGHIRPWLKSIVIDVVDGSLEPGDTVEVVLGDTSAGSHGTRAQTFVESAHEMRVLVDPTNAALVRPLPTSPLLTIVAGPATRLTAVVPTDATIGHPIAIRLRGDDFWGNPTTIADDVEISWRGSGSVTLSDKLQAVATTAAEGQFHVRLGELEGLSNPIRFSKQQPVTRRLWGDLHAQSDSTVGTGSEAEYFTFGRDQAFLDFISHQGNDFQLTAEDWSRLKNVMNRFHRDHSYVVIHGYEWSANSPAGGDRNVFFLDDDPPIFRSSHWQVAAEPETNDSPAHPASALFEKVKAHGNAFTCAHVGGRYADIVRYFDPDVCPLVEVTSCWGIFEWLLHDAIKHNYVVGVMANSDGHKGRPGAEGPGAGHFGILGGLTCVLAPELTRAAVFDALRNRHCYGTTGPRIAIDLDVNGHPMGWCGSITEPAQLRAHVHGTCPIEKIEIFRGLELATTVWNPAFDSIQSPRHIRVLWKGARHRGRGRRITWDGSIAVKGAKIRSARTVAFDSPGDGITSQSNSEVSFRSQTTGDADGIELELDGSEPATITLKCSEGTWTVTTDDPGLKDPAGKCFELGSLERQVRFQHYPDTSQLDNLPIDISYPVSATPGQPHTPWYIKVTQVDGHLAWTSPVYLT